MPALLSDVLTVARTYLNDDNNSQFTDPVLIPKAQEAHRELQEELWVVGSPLVRGQTSALSVASGTKLLNYVSTPALPADFLCPTALFESANGASGWTPMTETIYIPLGYVPAATMNWWSWQQEQIVLGGASGTVFIVAQYRRKITVPVLATDPIGILFGESFLGARTAAIAAGTMGNAEVYTAMTALAKENLGKVIVANRGQQKPSIRP